MVLVIFTACVAPDGPAGPGWRAPSATTQPVTTAPTSPTVPTTPPTTEAGALVFDGEPPTHLLILTLDTTRRDVIGRFSGGPTTPNLDRILGESVVLEDHRSCSNWTAPSMTCLVSGATPVERGFWPGTQDRAVPSRAPDAYGRTTLAGRLSDAGYDTVLVTANPVFSADQMHIGAGFEREVSAVGDGADGVAAVALAEASTLQGGAAPHFLHVHFMDPHAPYCPPAGYADLAGIPDLGRAPVAWCIDSYASNESYATAPDNVRAALHDMMTALYAGEIRYWDDVFGDLWDDLDAAGFLDDTLVVFATDHGQQFFERGGHGHGLALGAEENRSTAAFWAKNLRPGAWTGPTLHQDVGATLIALYGLPDAPDAPVSGIPIGEAPADRPLLAMNHFGDPTRLPTQLSLVRADTQLLYDWSGARSFYRLDSDPEGVADRYDPLDADVIASWTALDAFIADLRAEWDHLTDPVDQGP